MKTARVGGSYIGVQLLFVVFGSLLDTCLNGTGGDSFALLLCSFALFHASLNCQWVIISSLVNAAFPALSRSDLDTCSPVSVSMYSLLDCVIGRVDADASFGVLVEPAIVAMTD